MNENRWLKKETKHIKFNKERVLCNVERQKGFVCFFFFYWIFSILMNEIRVINQQQWAQCSVWCQTQITSQGEFHRNPHDSSIDAILTVWLTLWFHKSVEKSLKKRAEWVHRSQLCRKNVIYAHNEIENKLIKLYGKKWRCKNRRN